MPLERLLQSLKSDTVHYFANPGNGGDSVIAHATYELFQKFEISYKIISQTCAQPFDLSDKIIVYGGGGNLVKEYSDAHNFIEQNHKRARRLIVLPHTITDHVPLLSKLGENVVLICRQRTSYAHVKQHAKSAEILLADDLALSLDSSKILRSKPRHANGISLSKFFKLKARELCSRTFTSAHQPKVLQAFRTDVEKTDIEISKDNIDVSIRYGSGTDPDSAHWITHQIFSFINQFDEVRTNRLHVAIIAAMLNKNVLLRPNSNSKCQSVYEYSMKDRFPNVVFQP